MDWLGIAWGWNNIKLWRPDSLEGKWRYVLYDTDGALVILDKTSMRTTSILRAIRASQMHMRKFLIMP